MDQHEWVKGCLAFYQENDMTPEEGWEEAHYPIPKCLGGDETVWLTWEHHQIQGLLQSEEYRRVCFYAYDVKKYLEQDGREDLWELYWKWTRENGRKMGVKNMKKMHEHPNTKRARRENGRKTVKKMNEHPNTLENRRENGRNFPAEIRRESLKKMPVETRRESGRKTNSQRWRCLVTGFISNPGNLTQYQKARGINTSMRERVEG